MNGCIFVSLRRGVVILDFSDYLLLKEAKWYLKLNSILGRVNVSQFTGKYNQKGVPQYREKSLSRFLLSARGPVVVDHINRNPLDNRRKNLRLCSQSENMANKKRSTRNNGGTSHYRGVYRCKNKKRSWAVDIRKNRKLIYRAYFANEKEAALAYDLNAKKIHGEFAKTNF